MNCRVKVVDSPMPYRSEECFDRYYSHEYINPISGGIASRARALIIELESIRHEIEQLGLQS